MSVRVLGVAKEILVEISWARGFDLVSVNVMFCNPLQIVINFMS